MAEDEEKIKKEFLKHTKLLLRQDVMKLTFCGDGLAFLGCLLPLLFLHLCS